MVTYEKKIGHRDCSPWAHGDQNGHSQPWLSRDLGMIELWPSCDHTEDAVIELWPRCDLAVTELWLSCDLAVTELWPLLTVTEPWSLGPGAVTTVVTVSSRWPFIFSWETLDHSPESRLCCGCEKHGLRGRQSGENCHRIVLRRLKLTYAQATKWVPYLRDKYIKWLTLQGLLGILTQRLKINVSFFRKHKYLPISYIISQPEIWNETWKCFMSQKHNWNWQP